MVEILVNILFVIDYCAVLETPTRYTKCAYILRFTDSIFTFPTVPEVETVATKSTLHWPLKVPDPK